MQASNQSEPVKSQATSLDGTPIVFWRSGRGRPLVLVHGTTADRSRWEPMRPLLEPHVTVCAMDRRGRGGSGDSEPYAVEREFEDVAAVVDALAAESGGAVDVFGHSFGALCALGGARLTRNVRRLVLYEPVVLPNAGPADFADRADALLAEGRRDDVIELFFRELLELSEDAIAKFRADPSWQVRVAVAHTLPREDRAEHAFRFEPALFGDLRVPTLMLVGSESPPVLLESTEAIVGALPDARVHTLAGQDHLAVTTAPRVVADAVVPFLTESA